MFFLKKDAYVTTAHRFLMIVTASLMALTWAAPAASAEKAITPQSRNYDSLNRLPDWSGVWVISDESFRLAIGDTGIAPQSDNGARALAAEVPGHT